MKSEKLEIPVQLAQEILNYLATKPYREVAGLVSGMTQLKAVEFKKVEPEPVENKK